MTPLVSSLIRAMLSEIASAARDLESHGHRREGRDHYDALRYFTREYDALRKNDRDTSPF